MTKNTSLLSKTLKLFGCCTAICFTLTAPLFYLLTKYFYAEDLIDIIEAVNQRKGIPPLDLERDIMAGMMLQFVLIFCVITIAMFITMRFATKKLWQPFDDTLMKAEQFNLAQSSIPIFADTDIQEFARLNHSLEQLMRKDKETYRIQKEFTENASHELQTPIAIIRSKLDLLMQNEMNEREMRLIADLYELTIRMGHMNRNLLLLAKIENSQYTTLQNVDIVNMLAESLPLYEALQQDTTMKLADKRTDKQQTIGANPVLLECLVKNLVVNAIRHSPDKGEINITVGDSSLTVSNDSAEGKPLDEKKLFCRFSTAGTQQQDSHKGTARQKGNGLGLAIVKAICDFHHWTVSYRFKNGRHLFVVDFKNTETPDNAMS